MSDLEPGAVAVAGGLPTVVLAGPVSTGAAGATGRAPDDRMAVESCACRSCFCG
ncbi:hypothetical protein HBB16_02415 [Pseudonocardia sp. MCCB 268]|nr:hypothetical protein [Pseudonocardia cytotoxica]